MKAEERLRRLQKLANIGLPERAADLPRVEVTQDMVIKHGAPELKDHFFQVQPKTLDQLKEMVGVPNRVHEASGSQADRRFDVRESDLPKKESFEFSELNHYQQTAVMQTAHNLLYGYADPELVTKPPYVGVVGWMMSRAETLPVFAAEDLIVQDGQTVSFPDNAILTFNNVIVYGSGSIKLGANVKIFAELVEHRD